VSLNDTEISAVHAPVNFVHLLFLRLKFCRSCQCYATEAAKSITSLKTTGKDKRLSPLESFLKLWDSLKFVELSSNIY
jgi:hypothetical protein